MEVEETEENLYMFLISESEEPDPLTIRHYLSDADDTPQRLVK